MANYLIHNETTGTHTIIEADSAKQAVATSDTANDETVSVWTLRDTTARRFMPVTEEVHTIIRLDE